MISRVTGLAGLAVFLAAAFTPLPNVIARRLAVHARLEPADAIVVLGSGLGPDGSLDGPSLRRTVSGIVLQGQGWAPLLVFSGVTPPTGPTEPEVRAALARTLGIPGERIVTVLGARTTREEVTRVETALRSRSVRRVLLVTDAQHLIRARTQFERVGVQVLPVPANDIPVDGTTPAARLDLALGLLQESLARLYYRAAGYSG